MRCRLPVAAILFIGIALVGASNDAETAASEPKVNGPISKDAAGGNKKARGSSSGGTKVATLDLEAIFKLHAGFLNRTAEVRKEADVAEEAVRARAGEIANMQKRLIALGKPGKGSEIYRTLSAEIERAVNELTTLQEIKKKEFQDREMRIYADAYDEILSHLKSYATAHRIDLVLRVRNSAYDRSNPEEVIRELNRSVLYDVGDNITGDMIQLVNGQQRPPKDGTDATQSKATKMATLDLGAVFKIHRGFKERTDEMRKVVNVAEDDYNARRDPILNMQKKLEALAEPARNSEVYRALAAEIEQATSELRTLMEIKKKEFQEMEANIYADVYDDIQFHLKAYATARQIDLVLRVNNDPMERSDTQSVMKEFNKSVMYNVGNDITDDMIQLVEGKQLSPEKDREVTHSKANKIGAIDLGAVFKIHPGFLRRRAELAKDFEEVQSKEKTREDALTIKREKLAKLGENSDEHQRISAEIKRLSDDLTDNKAAKKKEFMQQEAGIYVDVYDEIMAHVKDYAAAHDVGLVFRVNNDAVNWSDFEELTRAVNKSVLYHDNLDMTAEIIDMINGKQSAPETGQTK